MQPGFWDILFVDVLVTARQRNNPVLYFMLPVGWGASDHIEIQSLNM
jgi:hypothetical protein